MINKTILTSSARCLALLVLMVTQVLTGTNAAYADTVSGTTTFDSSVWGNTNKNFSNGSKQTWTNYLTLTLNTATSGDNSRISGGYLCMYYQATLEITAPTGCTITGMTINGSNGGGTPSATSGNLSSEPGSTSYSWSGSASSVTISTDAGDRDSYDFQSIVVTYEVSLDAMATTNATGAVYSFNQDPNPFYGKSLYAKTITAGNQEMYFDAFGTEDPMILQNALDSSFYLHMPEQSRLRLQRSDSGSDVNITKAVFSFVSGSPSLSPDGGSYNSETHTWTGAESQIIFLFNEAADIKIIQSEASTPRTLKITSEGGGSISFTTATSSGVVEANQNNTFTINDGDSLTLTFTPRSDAYKLVTATVNGGNILSDIVGNSYTIPGVSGNVTVYGGYDIAVKNSTVLTENIDGIEWTYTVTGEGRCQLGGYVESGDNIPAVPTSTEAENIVIPSVINGNVVYGIMVQGFYGCSGLTGTLNIPETVTFIGDQAFQGTNFSGPLTLPSGLNDLCSYSFYNLYNLTGDLVIPESLTVLPAYAFFNCQGITSLTLPSTVTNLWTRCFGQMYGLKRITCNAVTPPTIGAENVFSDYSIPLFVPAESIDAYKTAEYWSNFTNIYAIGTVLDHTVTVSCGTNGTISGKVLSLEGSEYSAFEIAPGSEMPVTVPVGYTVEMTFTPNAGYFLTTVMQDDMFNITGQVMDNKLTLSDITSDMKITSEFLRMQMLLQINSQTDFGATNWEVIDVMEGESVTNGVVKNTVEDVPVPYGSTVRLTFNYDHTQYGLTKLIRNGADILGDVAGDVYTMTNYTTIDTITVAFAELATEAYAVLSADTTRLTFYYDNQKLVRGGMSVGPFSIPGDREWEMDAASITAVEFDGSFGGCTTLTSTAFWFYGFQKLTTIAGLGNLRTDNVQDMQFMFHDCNVLPNVILTGFNTANVTNMSGMFYKCHQLESLDLSSFNTAKVKNMSWMFFGLYSITNIRVGNEWSTAEVTEDEDMFMNCTNLVGGLGTTYDEYHVGAAYAHIDGGAANPGYFTPMGGYAEAPTFTWSADELTMTTGMEGATIYYTMTEGSSATAIPTAVQYTSPITVTSDVLITAYAEKEGMARSATTVLDYPYTAWSDLINIIAEAQNVSTQAATNDNVTNEQRDSLIDMISQSQGMYMARVDSAAAINYQASQLSALTESIRLLVEAVNEPYALLSEGNTKLTFYYDKQKAARGGMDVGPFAYGDGRGWNSVVSSITTVEFDASMAGCNTLTSTANWFDNCTNLSTIQGIEHLKTGNVTDMHFMFSDCSALTSLDLSGFDMSNVTSTRMMFQACRLLQNINLTGWDTHSVTDMFGMFMDCSLMKSIDLSGLNTSNVTNMQDVFAGCDSLTTVNVSGFNTSNVTTMWGMFRQTAITSLNLSSFNTAKVTDMANMFSNCPNLTTISVGSEWTTAAVTSSENMFAGCYNLVGGKGTVYDSSHTDAAYARIDGGAAAPGYFTDINAPASYTVKVTVVGKGEVTDGTTTVISNSNQTLTVPSGQATVLTLTPTTGYKLESVKNDTVDVTSQVETSATGIMTYDLGKVYDNYEITVTFVNDTKEAYYALSEGNTVKTFYYDTQKEARHGEDVGPDGMSSVTKVIFDASFADYRPTSTAMWLSDHDKLVTIEGIGNLNTSEVTNMFRMFAGCTSLTSLDLGGFNTGKVTDMGVMFYGCSSLTSLNVSSFKTDSVTDMSGMFYDCSSLTTLDVNNFNTAAVTNMRYMFSGCAGLTTLDLSSFNTAAVTDMGWMFSGCSSLTTIYAGNEWSTAAVAASADMFAGCTALVGSTGTTYNADHVDATYAHFDGSTANPGYLTRHLSKGDANGDGDINIADAVMSVTYILGEPTEQYFYRKMADMNGDDEIDIFDVTLIVKAVLDAGKPSGVRSILTPAGINRIATEDVRLTANADRIYLDIDQVEQFTAFQFDLTLPEGTELVGVKLTAGTTDHQLTFTKHGDGQYRGVGLSMSN